MRLEPNRGPAPKPEEHPNLSDATAPPEDTVASDNATQEAYRQAYLEQLRRRSCPGCGEDFTIF